MMPIMTGGLSAVPPDQVDGASAFNNVVQRTSSALGLAGLTSLVTYSREQFAAGPRAAGARGHPDARARARADR